MQRLKIRHQIISYLASLQFFRLSMLGPLLSDKCRAAKRIENEYINMLDAGQYRENLGSTIYHLS
jgi:hypothetical protein